MADSEEVLKELDVPGDVEIIGIVVNEKARSGRLRPRRCVRSVFRTPSRRRFLQNNQRQSLEDASRNLKKIEKKADEAGWERSFYISMAFGNPYGDEWSVRRNRGGGGLLELQEIRTISLADTVGLAPRRKSGSGFGGDGRVWLLELESTCTAVPIRLPPRSLRPTDAGCRRFDSAIGGLGGCPFAQDALVGNIATETVIEALGKRGAQLPPLKSLDALVRVTAEIGARYTASTAAD